METIKRARSADLVDHGRAMETNVSIIGLGAIGSNVAYLLSKMGIGFIVGCDDDVVEDINIEPQIYTPEDVGLEKVVAVAGYLCDETVYFPCRRRWAADTREPSDIIVSGVDSMESRQAIAASLTDYRYWNHYIDGRMGGNIVEIYHVTPQTLRSYYQKAVAQAKPMDIPCSASAVAYNGLLCAAYISRMVAAILNGEPVPDYVKIDLLAWSHTVVLQQHVDMV